MRACQSSLSGGGVAERFGVDGGEAAGDLAAAGAGVYSADNHSPPVLRPTLAGGGDDQPDAGTDVNGDDEAAFEGFVHGSAASLMGLAYAMCGDWGRAQDATQVAFERVYQRWGRLDDPWAYSRTVAVNATRDGWRRFGRRVRVGLPDLEDVVDPMIAVDERDRIVRALQTLPHGQRAVLVLRFWQDLTETQTAAALGVSVGTVKSQTSRAMTRLRGVLGQQETTSSSGVTP